MSRQSPFYDLHIKSSAVMVERNGWVLPEHFGDVQAELDACQNSIAVFDLSHFSRIRLSGDPASDCLAAVFGEKLNIPLQGCQKTLSLGDDNISVTLQHQDKGLLLITETPDHTSFLKQFEVAGPLCNVKVVDETFATAMIALKGPRAIPLLKEKLPIEIDHIAPGDVVSANMFFMRFVVALEGEGNCPGVTIILPAKIAPMAWEMLEKYGQSYDATLAGFQAWQHIHSV